MVRYIVLAVLLLAAVCTIITLLFAAVMLVSFAALIGLPLWLMWRSWSHRQGIGTRARSSIERLQELYIEGKIDLFEYERRVARLVAIEQ
jgi:threonine/homoserine/homoserine lactone efflux protein